VAGGVERDGDYPPEPELAAIAAACQLAPGLSLP
jgi:hypothetical protein